MKKFHTKSPEASRLRKRKYQIIRRYGFAEAPLPGALTLTHRRCGKPTSHFATDEGHPMWVLSFSLAGKKRTEVIAEDLANELGPLVERGREHREALAELMRLSAELLRLWLVEQREKKKARSSVRRKTVRRKATR